MPKHSPLPWRHGGDPEQTCVSRGRETLDTKGSLVYGGYFDRTPTDADDQFIVHACNMHYQLVEAVKALTGDPDCWVGGAMKRGAALLKQEEAFHAEQ